MAKKQNKLDKWLLTIPGGIVLIVVGIILVKIRMGTWMWEWFFIVLGLVILVKGLIDKFKKK